MYTIRINFLLYFSLFTLLLTACGQAPSQEEALQATVAALKTQVAQQPRPLGPTQEALPPTEMPLDVSASEIPRSTAALPAAQEPVPLNRIGSWEIAYEGVEELPQYSGGPPAEGHTWYGVNLVALNITNQPIDIGSNPLGYRDIGGYIQARWKNFVYSPYDFSGASGIILPGWPIRFQAIFDLPSAAKDSVTLQLMLPPPPYPTPQPNSTPEPVMINTLPTQLAPVPPPLVKLGTTLVFTDRLSITLTDVKMMRIGGVDSAPNGKVTLRPPDADSNDKGFPIAITMTITNLSGRDIGFPLEVDCSVGFQLLAHDNIWPGYGCGGNYNTIWDDQGQLSGSGSIPPGVSKKFILLPFWLRVKEETAVPPLLFVFFPNTPIWALYDLTGNGKDTLNQPLTLPRIELTPVPPPSLNISSAGEALQFAPGQLQVTGGQVIKVTFKNGSAAQKHNWVLVKGGEDVAAKVNNEAQTAGESKGYIPDDKTNIIANINLLNGGESGTVEFKAPAAGIYTFLCTFPDHYAAGMKGTFTIE